MSLYKNQYRNESTRAPWWNYGWNGAYFVTICIKNREHHFGKISEGMMTLSDMGKYAFDCWFEIPQHFPFVVLGDFVVMPDHVHKQYHDWDGVTPMNHFGPQSKNLASIIRGYKIGVTKNARLLNPAFQWQSRCHDHIIKNEEEFQRISIYIRNNPKKWAEDNLLK